MGKSSPIRRPRVPRWKRGKRRPTRWNAVSTNVGSGVGGGYLNSLLIPRRTATPVTSPPLLQLVSGQIDVEPWADEQEVTLDRIVGTMSVVGEESHDASIMVFGQDIYVKLGILVNEEVGMGIDLPEIDMFDQEAMEDYEWMWLWSGILHTQNGTRLDGSSIQWTRSLERIDVDIRNRRKIGQSDELNIYGQYALFNDELENAESLSNVSLLIDVRQILMSR